MKQSRSCELCAGEAAVYCDSDAAFLCWNCDAAVHGANFLVARHVRRVACAACCSFDDDRAPRVSGAGSRSRPRALLCRSCAPDQPNDESESEPEDRRPPSPAASSSSSSCLSTSESAFAAPPQKAASDRRAPAAAKRRRLDGRAEGVLIWWCRRMGLRSGAQCAASAARAIAAWGTAAAVLPPRVALAAALWSAIKLLEDVSGPAVLRRLEACSGVPARLIVAAESRIARSAGRAGVLEEGWAECS